MVDKAEQRRRAQEMSQKLAAEGVQAPKLTYPVSPKPAMQFGCAAAQQAKVKKPAPAKGGPKIDCAGKQLYVGDTVATSVDGIVSVLQIGKIVRITEDRVEVEILLINNGKSTSWPPRYKKVLKYPQAVAKIV